MAKRKNQSGSEAGKVTRIDETLKKLAAVTLSGVNHEENNATSTATRFLAGDPNCPVCGGLGYLRRDLPVDHPDFGKLLLCDCRKGDVAQRIHERLFAISNLEKLQHLTFENFQPRGRIGLSPWQADSLERAYHQSLQFGQNLNGWLVLQGGYGCGKTHLAAAVANFAVSVGVPTLFITVPDLLDALRFAYDDPQSTFEDRFEEIRSAPLLVMDDFGTHNATPWAQEKLFQIINFRYINRLPLLVTTNLLLEQIEGRIRSRLEDPELVTRLMINATDYRRPTDDSGHSELSSLAMHHEQTFLSWDDRNMEDLPREQVLSLKYAYQHAVKFSKSPKGWLVFTGTYACGKTHLAAAIGNAIADLGQPPYFIGVADLLDHLRATFNSNSPTSLDQVFEEVRTSPVLILDSWGGRSPTPWALEKLFQLVEYRYIGKRPTVITTAKFDNEIDQHLLSRLLDTRLCTICSITAPGYRGEVKPAKSSN